MTGSDLRSFVSRSRALVDATPPTTARETRAWLVDPFLETLGWTVRDDAVATDTVVEDARLEYVLAVDSIPALFVAVEPYGDDLEEGRARAVLEVMAWTGVDRAIYTNGREYMLLAGTTSVEHLGCRLPSLPEHESSLEQYSQAAARQQLDPASQDAVARRLAVNRSTLRDGIVDQLTAVAGDDYADAFETAADRFLDRLVVSFAEADSDRFDAASEAEDVSLEFMDPTSSTAEPTAPSTSISTPPPSRSADAGSSDEPSAEAADASADGNERADEADGENVRSPRSKSTDPDRPSTPRARRESGDATTDSTAGSDSSTDATAGTDADAPSDGSRSGSETAASGGDTTQSDDDAATGAGAGDRDADETDDGDGEYVARFFNERGSIGAIGHSRSDRALVGVAEYLFERGLSGISVPWSPDDDGNVPTLLNDEPVRATGEPMAAPRELSNGLYLETAGDAATHAQVAKALASRAGLRVMVTGDWDS